MSTPQPPYGPSAHPVPPAAPAPQKPRPGKTVPALALVSAIVGTLVVCLGFLSFVPAIGRTLGFVSFIGWAFLIAGLVLSIIALVKKAAAMGLSIAGLVVSIAGGVIGVAAGVVVMIAGLVTYTTTIIEEYGDLVPSDPDSGWSVPEGSADPDVQADCEEVLAADPGGTSQPGDLGALFDSLAERTSTDAVGDPLDDLADAYEDMAEATTPDDVATATDAAHRAAADLGAACGFDIDDLP